MKNILKILLFIAMIPFIFLLRWIYRDFDIIISNETQGQES